MPRLNDESREQIRTLYASGLSGSKVGQATGYSLPTVMKVVREAGLERLYGPSSARRSGRAVHWTRVQNDPGRGGWAWRGKYKGKNVLLSESRVLASKKLGRILRDDEYVHFHDGDPLNTDEENLYVDEHMRPKYGLATRTCGACEVEQNYPSDFPPQGGICKNCRNERHRRSKLRRKYGLTDEQVDSMPDGCEICGDPCVTGRRPAADHNHATGKFRGWLCVRHNMGIGYFQDDVEQLRAAIEYLESR